MFAEDVVRALLGTEHPLDACPDHLTLEPGVSEDTGKSTDIAVDAVRSMKAWAYQRPLFGATKTVLVDGAERLSDAAANTFLKVLEEPPAYLTFVLVTSHIGSVLPTILSRCQQMAFHPLPEKEMDAVLVGQRLDADDRKLVRAVADGRPGAALSMIRDGRFPEAARAIAQLERLLSAGISERLIAARSISEAESMPSIIAWWLSWTHAQLVARPKLAPVAGGLLELTAALAETKYNRRLALERFFLELP
jgi:DNA polymerase-3 subunit delta'